MTLEGRVLKAAGLYQVPPRRRSLLVKNYSNVFEENFSFEVMMINFPWMSFGMLRFAPTACYHLVYFHDEPWKNVETINARELGCFPWNASDRSIGAVCLGNNWASSPQETEEFFWNTSLPLYAATPSLLQDTLNEAVKSFWPYGLHGLGTKKLERP